MITKGRNARWTGLGCRNRGALLAAAGRIGRAGQAADARTRGICPGRDLASRLGCARQGHLRQARSRGHIDSDPKPVAPARHRRKAIRIRGINSHGSHQGGCGGLDVVATAGEAIEVKSNPTTQVIVRKDSGIKSVADLKGKAIAAPTLGAVIHVATLYWLKKNGVDPASIRGVEVPFPNMGDQLKAGNVDAVEALEPFAGALLAAGNVSLGDPLLAAGDEVLFPFWISDGAWARANRPVIKAWIDALTEAQTYMDANPADTRAILAKYSRLPPEIVAKVPLPTYRFTIKPDELGVWIDVLKDLGQLSVPIDKAKIVVTAP